LAIKSIWREKALLFLDKYDSSSGDKINQTALARALGISRQTLWRDKAIRTRLLELSASSGSGGRKNRDSRIDDLEKKIRIVKYENGLLIQSFLLACRRLRENGLDPQSYLAQSASEIEAAFPNWTAKRIFDFE
jgi:predicted DNA-binding transcriptional regulator YafY